MNFDVLINRANPNNPILAKVGALTIGTFPTLTKGEKGTLRFRFYDGVTAGRVLNFTSIKYACKTSFAADANTVLWLPALTEGNDADGYFYSALLDTDTVNLNDALINIGSKEFVSEIEITFIDGSEKKYQFKQTLRNSLITDVTPSISFPDYPEIDDLQLKSEKGEANGYASLDGTGKVPSAQLPSDVERTTNKNQPNGYVGIDDDGDVSFTGDVSHYGNMTHHGDATYSGPVTFSNNIEIHGLESHHSNETHYGNEVHNGEVTYSGPVIFNTIETHTGLEYHNGNEVHNGEVTYSGPVNTTGVESHTGLEYHSGNEEHYGSELHMGYATYSGPVLFNSTLDINGTANFGESSLLNGTVNLGYCTIEVASEYGMINFSNNGSANFNEGGIAIFASGSVLSHQAGSVLGLFGAIPTTQPSAVANATDAASVITQFNALLGKLRTLGIIAT